MNTGVTSTVGELEVHVVQPEAGARIGCLQRPGQLVAIEEAGDGGDPRVAQRGRGVRVWRRRHRAPEETPSLRKASMHDRDHREGVSR